MCGIYGVLSMQGPLRRDRGVLNRMGDTIRHRGPDDAGQYADSRMLLGMRRLSIIDVGGGHQPLFSEDGNIVTVCNGEIYNFRELRRVLEAAGHRFATHSDSEVIVHLYEEHGLRFLEHLEGMFALALWDRTRQRLVLARDPLGIKPLYHWQENDELIFASESKALLRVPGLTPRLDHEALTQYLAFGYVSAPQSLFAGIRKLPPATALIAEHGRVQYQRYWTLPRDVDASVKPRDWQEMLRTELDRAVREQMVSDVPIGAFLSGGLDSSAVVALMSRNSDRPVRTYSIGFSGSSGAELYNELPFARIVAKAFHTEHREIIVQPSVAELLPQLIWHLDEPMSDAAFITTYLVSKFAREDVTVILSGVGGDELFGGYTRYLDHHYRRSYQRIPASIRRSVFDPIARRLPSDRHGRVLNKLRLAKGFLLADALGFEDRYLRFMEVFSSSDRQQLLRADSPASFDNCIARAFAGTSASDPLRRLMEVDLATQMPEDLLMLTDKMSMAVSLECRVPLLDQRLTALAARMPQEVKMHNGELKHILKRALHDLLPAEILTRGKRGFGAPIGAWFKSELSPLIDNLLSAKSIERRGLFESSVVRRIVLEHAQGREDRTDHLLSLVNLEIWCRLYLDGDTVADVTDEIRERVAA
jgi:asparagine synthase (glutamine-hydrolysing)